MSIRLLEPGFLWLLPLVALLWYWPRRDHAQLRPFLLRATALVCVILALARPVVSGADESTHLVVVVDASDSAATEPSTQALRRDVERADRATLVRIGSGGGAPQDGRFDQVVDVPATAGGSPLGAALLAAAAAIPSGARGSVVVLTDGLATDEGYALAAAELEERGLPVSFLRTSARDLGARPISLDPVGTLRVGHDAHVRVRGVGAPAIVRLLGPDGLLAEAPANTDGDRFDAVLEFEPPAAGFLEVEVVAGEHALRALLAVQDPLPVLWAGGRVRGGDVALGKLLGPGFDVRPLPRFDESPAENADLRREAIDAALASAPLVMLDDVPADALPEGFLDALAESVRERGTGLLMSGGSAAFGPGGYADTPIEETLPVDFLQREEKRDPSTTLVVIIDTSGSMGGERVQLAKEVARLAIQRLLPHDKVGIVEFYGAKRWAAPIQPASNHIEIERALNRLDAGGGTVILPAIEEAFYGLQNVDTRYKHVLVLTDGGVERGAFEPLVRRMADKGMTVSTVLVGGTLHSEFLVDIANWGKGRFYAVPNRFNLPEVLLKQPTSAQLPAYRTGEYAVDPDGGPLWWGGERPSELPPVAGYVESDTRTGAEVLLRVRETKQPLVATWMWGAGRTATFATEPTGDGTEPWKEWPDYGRFLGRLLALCASPDQGPFRFTARREGHDVVVTATAHRPTVARPVAGVDGGESLVFESIGRDRYEARTVADPRADVALLVGSDEDGSASGSRRLVARADVVPEFAVDPDHALDLEALARATNGNDVAVGGVAAAATARSSRDVRHVAPLLALIALLVYLADVLLRRLPRTSYSAARP